MNFSRLLRVAFCCLVLWSAQARLAGRLLAAEPKPLKAAIFVDNRAGKELEDKVDVMEDLLTSRVAGKGFSIISRQHAIDALNRSGGGTELDKQLSSQSSAKALAQSLGADLILKVSLTTYGYEKKPFKNGVIETVNDTYTLRAGYLILDANGAGSLAGDTVKVAKTLRATPGNPTVTTEIINELLDEAAERLAATLPEKRVELPPGLAQVEQADLTVICGVTDLVQQPMTIPDLRFMPDGQMVRGTNSLDLQALDVTVELNGTVIGSAPGVFHAPRGLQKLRLTREGFKPWERTINIVPGQKLRVALQMSEQGYERWKDSTKFLAELEAGKKMTQAQVTAIEGFAQMLRQSGFKVDVKHDSKIDMKSEGKSPFDGAKFDILKGAL
jgi:hypothetical protein